MKIPAEDAVIEAKVRVALTDQLRVLSITGSIEALLGFSPDDYLAARVSLKKQIHPHDIDLAEALFSPETPGKSGVVNIRLRQANGRIRCIKAHFSKEISSGDTVLDLWLQDAKGLKRTMADSSAMVNFTAMMESTDDYIYFKDRNHVFTGASQTLVSLCAPAEHWTDLIGLTDYDVFPEEFADTYYRLEKQVFAGIPVAHEVQETLGKDGRKGWVDNRKYPIRDASGAVIGLYGIARDITKSKRAMEAWRESEETLQLTLESVGVGYWSLDLVTHVATRSLQAYRIFGYKESQTDWSYERFLTHVHPEDRADVGRSLQSGTAAKTGFSFECRITRHDGGLGWIRVQGHVLTNAAGEAVRSIGVLTDITERKQAEAKLRMMQAGMENLADGVFWISVDGRIRAVNKAGCQMIGYTREELLNVPSSQVDPRWSPETWSKHFDELRQRTTLRFEFEQLHRDGRLTPVEISASYLKIGEEELNCSVVRDITAQVMAEKDLRASLRQVRNLQIALDHHSIVAITNVEGQITYANDKFCTISKYSLGELLGQDHRILNSGHHPKEFFRDLWATILQGRVWQGDVKNRAKDGSYYWVAATIVPFFDDEGNVREYVAIRTDITERKQSEQALQDANARLHRLSRDLIEAQEAERRSLARNLHDGMGQTLTAAKIRLQSLIRFPDAKSQVMRIEESVGVIDQVLQQVRQLALDLRPPLLDDMGLGAALSWIADHHSSIGFSLDLTVPVDLPRFNFETEITAFRVAQEALTNVARHARARHARLMVHMQPDTLEISLCDDGVGFDVAAIRKRAAQGGSFGVLGMEERVQLVGGRLEIKSQLGQGTEVHAWIPRTVRQEAQD